MDRVDRGRGIVLYDFLYCQGGAERVTLELVRGLGDADLGFGFRDRRAFPDGFLPEVGVRDLGVSARFAGGRTLAGLWAWHTRAGFLREYEWVIYSGALAPEAVHRHPHGPNLYYCHTTPRFAYDLRDYYLARLPRWKRPVFHALAALVRSRYARALARMDLILANSENVRRRLHRFLRVDAEVIHPPCDLAGYRWRGQGGYYLSTARLEPYKRVDLAIEAFRRMPERRLVVASGGSERRRLEALAAGAPNVSFTGWLDDAGLRALVGNAIATLYLAEDEDFGMSPVESMAAGKPVIGVAEGGLLETLVHGVTGLLIPPHPTHEAVARAVSALDPARALAMRPACETRARQFSRELFVGRMDAAVDRVVRARRRA